MPQRPWFPLALCLLSAFPSLGVQAAAWSPDGRQIVYSFIGGPEKLYLVNADGSGPTELLVRDERDFRAEWAPDGSHIVFTSMVDGVHVSRA